MGGKRLEHYWSNEIKSLLDTYQQFQILIPSDDVQGSYHNGEDGRYIETLISQCLSKFLPRNLEILTGFILRAGVRENNIGKSRKKDPDRHSSQLDLMVYDTGNYPVYQRFGNTAVVPPEGVIAVISVKKHLRAQHLSKEIAALQTAGQLCALPGCKGPFLALAAMEDKISPSPANSGPKVFREVEQVFSGRKPVCYEEMPAFVGCLSQWTIHKAHKKGACKALYQFFSHEEGEEHLGFQYLVKGIFDVYYAKERLHGPQPGYISFPSGKSYDRLLGSITYQSEGSIPGNYKQKEDLP